MSLDPRIQDLKYSAQILKKLALLQVKIPTKMKNTLHRGNAVCFQNRCQGHAEGFELCNGSSFYPRSAILLINFFHCLVFLPKVASFSGHEGACVGV